MLNLISKIHYYSDIYLLLKIFLFSIRISLSPDRYLIPLADPKPGRVRLEREKITRYVNLCIYLRNLLGFSDTCLSCSILLCHFLRLSGVDALVNFAARSTGKSITGHCWVSTDQENTEEDWKVIFRYPSDKVRMFKEEIEGAFSIRDGGCS